MPYVPSRKTDGVSDDREVLDIAVECLANKAAGRITNNLSLIRVYINAFVNLSDALYWKLWGVCSYEIQQGPSVELAQVIFDVSAKYGYEGAYLGELNYAVTRFIQRVPQIKVREGVWDQELRYWIYAATVEALTCAARRSAERFNGVSGVFEDVKDEYKRRVNVAYEAEQILKSGDCYNTPYYTRLIEVVDESGTLIGHQEVMLKRSDDSLYHDLLDFQMVARKR